MISDSDLDWLRSALSALRGERATTMPWVALTSLAQRGDDESRYAIDLRAMDVLGIPVVVRQPAQSPLPQLHALSARERQVAGLLARGLPNKAIARELSISVATVKDHVHKVLSKMGASSRSQIAAMLGRAVAL
jgi:two-component system, NarL family, nitrate/nitrite response regulator NarL